MELPFAESWKIKMVEPIRKSTRSEREKWLKAANYNVFQLNAEEVYIDLLTDSGTGAMSDRQWAGVMMGDESYAGATSFRNLQKAIEKITGFKYVVPTHQGRAAENVLFSVLVKAGDYIPGNSHFDTTKGHIESRKAFAVDLTVDDAKDTQKEVPFKGNVDIDKLEKFLAEKADKVPFIIVTITNNTAGGQPVSMDNLRRVRQVADKYNKPVVFDSARFAENAYFIKVREKGYENKTIKEICLEMFSLADAMTMSAKKDAIVNMGGFIATRKQDWYDKAKVLGIIYEGYLTYGGMNGRDMNALAIGLDENTEFDNLETRIKQVEYLAAKLDEYGIPYQRPAGGHAIFVDATRVLTHVLNALLQQPQIGVSRSDTYRRALSGSWYQRLRNRLSACRPRPCYSRKPLRWARPAASGYTASCVYKQSYGRGGCSPQKCFRPPRKHNPRSENSMGSRDNASLHR